MMETQRKLYCDQQAFLGLLKKRGIRDQAVLEAMAAVPREQFVGLNLAEFAYDDTPLPIEEGQTISQPYIVALMTEALRLKPGDTVLEVGTGSGYAAAVLSRVAGKVYTIERHRSLARNRGRDFTTVADRPGAQARAGIGLVRPAQPARCGRFNNAC